MFATIMIAHMREDAHATRQYCIVNAAVVYSTLNMHQTLLSLFMIFNCLNAYLNRRNYEVGKFKVCSWFYFIYLFSNNRGT